MNVICVPTVRDFISELLRQYGVTSPRFIETYLQESVREVDGAPFPRRYLRPIRRIGVRLTAERGHGTEDVFLWFWEGSVYAPGNGRVFPDDPPRWEAYIQVDAAREAARLIREALVMAGLNPANIHPGAIAVPRDLELVRGSTEGVLLWEKEDNGTLTVKLDPAWAAACYEWSLHDPAEAAAPAGRSS